jgi:hypothetical protein
MENRPDALQSSRRSQCFSTSVWMAFSVWQVLGFLPQDTVMGIGKMATIVRTMCDPVQTMSSIRQERAYQVQPSGRQPSWFGRSSFIYGNCVHQFNCPDVILQGPDAQSLIMVISCSRSATVRMLGQQHPDMALLWKLSVLLWKGGRSWPSGRSVKPSGHPRVFGHNFLLKYRIGTKLASLER